MELPQIGKNCQLDNCNSLDFLPVACPLCQYTFCGQHRLPLDHQCSQCIDNQLIQCNTCYRFIKAPTGLKTSLEKHKQSNCQLYLYNTQIQKINRQCTVHGCKGIDPRIGPVQCDGCNQDFCLRHRHTSSHQCNSLNHDQQRKLDRKTAAQEKLQKTFHPPPLSRKSVVAPVKSSGIVELMKIKQQAKNGTGSENIPVTSRIYIYITCSTLDSQQFVYFDKKISVGRALDSIADICKINNKNHTLSPSDPERLELYKCPEMIVLDKSVSLEKALKNLDTVLLQRQGIISLQAA